MSNELPDNVQEIDHVLSSKCSIACTSEEPPYLEKVPEGCIDTGPQSRS